jgi:NADP-dependent 3-hydroxy acid dehydrogenase YdfG
MITKAVDTFGGLNLAFNNGGIVKASSFLGICVFSGSAVYNASKFAVIGLAK